jgi:hypothetical protein
MNNEILSFFLFGFATVLVNGALPTFFMPPDQGVMTYDNAEAECAAQGAHLASIHSLADFQAVLALCPINCWTGMHRQDADAIKWEWSDSSAPDYGFNPDATPTAGMPWRGDEPNNPAGEKCAVIHETGYNDVVCSGTNQPVCRRLGPSCNLIDVDFFLDSCSTKYDDQNTRMDGIVTNVGNAQTAADNAMGEAQNVRSEFIAADTQVTTHCDNSVEAIHRELHAFMTGVGSPMAAKSPGLFNSLPLTLNEDGTLNAVFLEAVIALLIAMNGFLFVVVGCMWSKFNRVVADKNSIAYYDGVGQLTTESENNA